MTKLLHFSHKISYDANAGPQFVYKIPLPDAFYRQEGPKWIHVRNIIWIHAADDNFIYPDLMSCHATFNTSPASYDQFICMTNRPPSYDLKFKVDTNIKYFELWFVDETEFESEEWAAVTQDDRVIIELELEF